MASPILPAPMRAIFGVLSILVIFCFGFCVCFLLFGEL